MPPGQNPGEELSQHWSLPNQGQRPNSPGSQPGAALCGDTGAVTPPYPTGRRIARCVQPSSPGSPPLSQTALLAAPCVSVSEDSTVGTARDSRQTGQPAGQEMLARGPRGWQPGHPAMAQLSELGEDCILYMLLGGATPAGRTLHLLLPVTSVEQRLGFQKGLGSSCCQDMCLRSMLRCLSSQLFKRQRQVDPRFQPSLGKLGT